MSAFESPSTATQNRDRQPVRPSSVGYYQWKEYRCAYEAYLPTTGASGKPALLLIHPIGVGLSRLFWRRFCGTWRQLESDRAIYNPDLLGCGDSDLAQMPYTPADWAAQLAYFLKDVVRRPTILVAQGALAPVAIELALLPEVRHLMRGIIFSGPPAWSIVTQPVPEWRQKLLWSLFESPFGNGFYRYARRQAFLQSFSQRKLFADGDLVDREWLAMLAEGSEDMRSRFAVFAFLAGFWRQNYADKLQQISVPTYVVFGELASSIGRDGKPETAQERLSAYLKGMSKATGTTMTGRNVLPYENTPEFITAIEAFVMQITT